MGEVKPSVGRKNSRENHQQGEDWTKRRAAGSTLKIKGGGAG